jgi:hypothetical protein
MEYQRMSPEKDRQVAQYLADHADEYHGVVRLTWPRVYRFDVALLPHNEIFNDAFWAAVGPETGFSVAEQPDGSWVTGL